MTKKKAAPSGPRHGYDGSGHIDPAHAARLLDLARQDRSPDPEAFIETASTDDDWAEELGEATVESMTAGEDEHAARLETEVEEERGGPFTETSGNHEFAGGTDASNIAEATREPFPIANGDGEADER